MERRTKCAVGSNRERGAVLVLVAISMAILLGFVALSVDLGYFFVTRNEVQNIADGSSLAGARALGGIYQDLSYADQRNFYCGESCQTLVRNTAQDVASKNRAGGIDMTVRVEDVLIGRWSKDVFTVTNDQPDAVYVAARRDEVANGPISTFFARVLGMNEASINAVAIAAMTGQGNVAEGELSIPIAIDEYFWGDDAKCNDYIKFYPSNDPESCAGWTSWEYGSNDITIRRILDEVEGYENPELFAGESVINFTGGTLSTQVFNSLLNLFKREGCATFAGADLPRDYLPGGEDGCVGWLDVLGVEYKDLRVPLMTVDNKGNPVQEKWPDGELRYLHQWETYVPVYEAQDCANPNQSMMIVGFTSVVITNVLNSPDKLVEGVVVCDKVNPEPNRGGGGEFGLKGPIPGLVR